MIFLFSEVYEQSRYNQMCVILVRQMNMRMYTQTLLQLQKKKGNLPLFLDATFILFPMQETDSERL